MTTDNFDSRKKATLGELRTLIEVANEKLKHKETEVRQLRRELDVAHTKAKQSDAKLEVSTRKETQLETEIKLRDSSINSKNSTAKLQGVFASLLSVFAGLLASLGTNMLTSSPLDAKGFILIVFALFASFLVSYITIFILGGNQ
jgi:hypothetical protein